LNVLGDSKTIIRMMIQGSKSKYLRLKRVIDRTHIITRTLKNFFLHVLRDNNKEADKMAKEAIRRPSRTLGVGGKEDLAP